MDATERQSLIRALALRSYQPTVECVLAVRGLHALTDEALELVEKILDQIEHKPEVDDAFGLERAVRAINIAGPPWGVKRAGFARAGFG